MSMYCVVVKNTFFELESDKNCSTNCSSAKSSPRGQPKQPLLRKCYSMPVDFLPVPHETKSDKRRNTCPPAVDLTLVKDSDKSKSNRLMRYAKNKPLHNRTTVMIRNIPSKCTQDQLMVEISQVSELFNFVYMPTSRRKEGNLGYAFVNFVNGDEASRFIEAFTDRDFLNTAPKSKKHAEVSFAVLQGFKENVRFYKRCKVGKTQGGPYINSKIKVSAPVAAH